MTTPLSLAPGFSRVIDGSCGENRFNGFPSGRSQAAEAAVVLAARPTRLKPGANERPIGGLALHDFNPV